MEDQQQKVKEKAEKEEQKRKEKEETVLTFLQKHKGDFEKLKDEIEQPDKNQKQEKFRKEDKFALILSNMTYNTSKTTMKDLPAVQDDHRNIKQTVQMLNIPEENVFEAENVTYDKMIEITTRMTELILSRSRVLKLETGILGEREQLKGFKWDRVKVRAMEEGAPHDWIIIDLTEEEQKDLKSLIQL